MNITPTLPSPQQQPPEREHRTVSAVQPSRRARDVSDDSADRGVVRRPQLDQEGLAARAEAYARQVPTPSSRAGRALAAYANVADQGDRTELRDLLGFDAYA